jgi:hypothetical protein
MVMRFGGTDSDGNSDSEGRKTISEVLRTTGIMVIRYIYIFLQGKRICLGSCRVYRSFAHELSHSTNYRHERHNTRSKAKTRSCSWFLTIWQRGLSKPGP